MRRHRHTTALTSHLTMAIVATMIYRVKSLCKLRFNPEGVGLCLAAALDKPIRNGSFVSGWLVVRDADDQCCGRAPLWQLPVEPSRSNQSIETLGMARKA